MEDDSLNLRRQRSAEREYQRKISMHLDSATPLTTGRTPALLCLMYRRHFTTLCTSSDPGTRKINTSKYARTSPLLLSLKNYKMSRLPFYWLCVRAPCCCQSLLCTFRTTAAAVCRKSALKSSSCDESLRSKQRGKKDSGPTPSCLFEPQHPVSCRVRQSPAWRQHEQQRECATWSVL